MLSKCPYVATDKKNDMRLNNSRRANTEMLLVGRYTSIEARDLGRHGEMALQISCIGNKQRKSTYTLDLPLNLLVNTQWS